jgi:myo-inositol-1-phosphate synthase
MIRVAIVGIGNCASSLVQGLHFYGPEGHEAKGVISPEIAEYKSGDIQVVAAFDIDVRKVGKDLSEAIFEEPNCTYVFSRPPKSGVIVQRGQTMDGLGSPYLRDVVPESLEQPVDVAEVLRESGAEIVVGYLPVGSEKAVRFYADCAIAARCGYVNCIPAFLASGDYAKKFKDACLPIVGDDIKSQVGATIIHRQLVHLLRMRGVTLKHTSQLNVGGNTDFLNMLDRSRLASKKVSKTEAVTSIMGVKLPAEDVHVGPSDHVAWLKDRKWCHIKLEGENYGGAPMMIELKLEVWDSPNSAGVVVDAIRYAKVALDRHQGGPLYAASAFLMKHPPVQLEDNEALANIREWLAAK